MGASITQLQSSQSHLEVVQRLALLKVLFWKETTLLQLVTKLAQSCTSDASSVRTFRHSKSQSRPTIQNSTRLLLDIFLKDQTGQSFAIGTRSKWIIIILIFNVYLCDISVKVFWKTILLKLIFACKHRCIRHVVLLTSLHVCCR